MVMATQTRHAAGRRATPFDSEKFILERPTEFRIWRFQARRAFAYGSSLRFAQNEQQQHGRGGNETAFWR